MEATTLSEAQARGTVRIALRKGGLDPSTVDVDDMSRVLERIMPKELEVRGYADAKEICQSLRSTLAGADLSSVPTDEQGAESILRRLLGD